ncbi:MAG: DNA adenine methylase [Candidatus Omnitrophota bacterium]
MIKKMIASKLSKQIMSPLRYPGGKGLLAEYFIKIIQQNNLAGCRYYEPFAGGGGVALGLLFKGIVSEIVLNDADYHIYCFWKAMIECNDKFIESLNAVPITIAEWNKQKEIYQSPKKHTIFEVAFSTFFLNRCNRSGIIAGAGPIGGRVQKGNWRLDARFNKSSLVQRIMQIGKLKDRITIKNFDAIGFLKESLPRGNARTNVLVYCDPPYVSAGNKLYLNFYQDKDHKKLAKYLLSQKGLRWIVTYDDHPLIRNLYKVSQEWIFSLGYSLQVNRKGKELLIAPNYVILPDKSSITSAKWNLIKKLNDSEELMEVLI